MVSSSFILLRLVSASQRFQSSVHSRGRAGIFGPSFIATPIHLTAPPVLASPVEDVASPSSSVLSQLTFFSTTRPSVLSSAVAIMMVSSSFIVLRLLSASQCLQSSLHSRGRPGIFRPYFIATPIRLTTPPVLASPVEDVAAMSSPVLLQLTFFSTSILPVPSPAVEDSVASSRFILLTAIRTALQSLHHSRGPAGHF